MPEILAPAGAHDSMSAALAAGADAVYFGLDDGFNARARATNFSSENLAATVAWIHRAGVRAYVTLNTLVFEPELPIVEELIRRVAAAGTDAIIVQDPAVALLARSICPALEVHASTQMTASSPLAAELLRSLGLTRVVVPRELSVDEIRAYAAGTSLPLEVFIHGALCVSWSGQCLSSEAWGGRSANRGQCAQACRLPYELVVDNTTRDLGDVAYLLSPKDLVGLDAVPALSEIGVASLKIEGRLKGPQYVATSVAQYRAAIAAAGGPPVPASSAALPIPHDEPALHIAYSRGISSGFLAGADHQTLVEGRFPQHRGVPLGRVAAISGDAVHVIPDAAQRPITGGLATETPPTRTQPLDHDARTRLTPRAGMGVVFDRSHPGSPEQGGPIFGVTPDVDAGYWLSFGNPGPDLSQVEPGNFVWISSDPRVARAGDKASEAGEAPLGRIPVALTVRGAVNTPISVTATAPGRDNRLATASATTNSAAAAARNAGLSHDVLADKLGSFGGTPFHLGSLDTTALSPGLHIPVSELKDLRRQLVTSLEDQITRVDRDVAASSVLETVRSELRAARSPSPAAPVTVVPLCRTDAQLDAVLDAGARDVELDWMELVGLRRAVERARARNVRVGIATVRVQKPGEQTIDQHLVKLAPDYLLVRSWGSLAALLDLTRDLPSPPTLHGDFSLNVTNALTADWVLARGLASVTAAHDLDRDQLLALLDRTQPGDIDVTVHHHVPTFHTEHCVYAHLLSTGRDFRTCGRPCEQHQISLRDRVNLVHPVVVDVGCRNTIFNAQAQTAATLVPDLLTRGVRRLRVELVRESGPEAARVYAAYAGLVTGAVSPLDVVRAASAHEQFGVTRGTMRTLTVLR